MHIFAKSVYINAFYAATVCLDHVLGGLDMWHSPQALMWGGVGVFAQVLYADMWSDIGCSGV
jgi:hypothetical protein